LAGSVDRRRAAKAALDAPVDRRRDDRKCVEWFDFVGYGFFALRPSDGNEAKDKSRGWLARSAAVYAAANAWHNRSVPEADQRSLTTTIRAFAKEKVYRSGQIG